MRTCSLQLVVLSSVVTMHARVRFGLGRYVILWPRLNLISTVSPADFGEVSVTLSFEECEARQCVGISVVDDLINEPVETLSLSLTANPELHLTLHPQTSEVAILDNDGKKSFYECIFKALSFSYCYIVVVL